MSEKDGPTFKEALADPRTVLMVRGAIKVSALGHLEHFCMENFGRSGYLKVTHDAGWSQIHMPAPSKTKKGFQGGRTMSEDSKTGKLDRLLWIDIETTGLNPEQDRILEAEMRVTDMRGEEDDDRVHVIIPLGDRLKISHTALEMHTANRLLDEVFRTDRSQDDPYDALMVYVDEMSSYYTLHPAGSSVHFDIAFLSHALPGLFDGCHHRRLDVSSMRMAFDTAGVALPEQAPTDHRTSTCLDRDIKQYRTMLDMLGGLREEDGR